MSRPYLCREWLVQDARNAVLDALDAWAQASGLPIAGRVVQGATDRDLRHLFPAIDAQVERVINRTGVSVPTLPLSEDR